MKTILIGFDLDDRALDLRFGATRDQNRSFLLPETNYSINRRQSK
jgi:hypothetical protein